VVVAIGDRIADRSGEALESLHANAVRLKGSGSAIQRQQAEELLPLFGATLEQRRLARIATRAQARRASARCRKAGP
jgi:hypothetical protein